MRTFLRLLRLLRPFAWEVLLSVLLGTATVASGIGLLGTSAYLIALAALQPGIAPLQVAIVGVRFFGLLRGVLRYAERLSTHSVNFRLLAELRAWFYERIEPLVPARLGTFQAGDLLNRAVADVDVLQDFYVRLVAPPCVALLAGAGMSWFIGRYAALLGGLLAGGMLAAGVGIPALVYLASRPAERRITQARARLNARLVDCLQGMPDWVAFGQEQSLLGGLRTAGGQYTQAAEAAANLGSAGGALASFTGHATLWLVVLAAIPLVGAGALDGVSLAVAALLTLASFEAVLPLNQAVALLEGALQSARRLFEIADQAPAVTNPPGALPLPEEWDLLITGLTFRYAEALPPALDGVHLRLRKGRVTALVGANGAGKSTLAGLILRLWDAPPGTIFLKGVDIRLYRAEELRKQIALVPQSPYLFSGSLADNLRLGNPQAGDEALRRAVQLAGLDELVARLPGGLSAQVGAQGMQLSGGERRRVAAARALLRDAKLLILDEPAANLDPHSARRLLRSLIESSRERAVLWITHDLTGLEQADEIVVLSQGRVIEQGAPAELLERRGWYARALQIQRESLL